MSFGPQEPAYKFLLNASPGQVLEVKTVKNDKGFWDWVEAGPAGEANAAAAPSGKAVGASPAPRNTYETPEERAVKQKYIVRQSSISSAIEYAKLNGKKSPSVEELLVVARQFEDYVFGTTTPTQQSVFSAIAEMSDDIPV